MSYYHFLCSIVEELNDKAADLVLWEKRFDEAEQLWTKSDLVWDRAGKAARYNA